MSDRQKINIFFGVLQNFINSFMCAMRGKGLKIADLGIMRVTTVNQPTSSKELSVMRGVNYPVIDYINGVFTEL